MHAACFHPAARKKPVKDSPRFLGADPSITATPQVGAVSALTALTYYGTPTVTPSYQWLLDTVAIGAATSATYTPITGDATHTLQCDITLTGPSGTTPVTKRTAGLIVLAAVGGGGSSYSPVWAPDDFFADGTAVSSIVGFKIYGSQTRGDLLPALLATVANPSATTTTVSGLAAGDWYFGVSAYTASAESAVISYPKVTLT